MKETISGELLPNQELSDQFKGLDDDKVANSVITGELFGSGTDGENEVNQRIEEIAIEGVKNDAKFRIAKLYYTLKHDIDSALKKIEEISNPAEQARCLSHLAVAVLENDNDVILADKIFSRIKRDDLDEIQQNGYLKPYIEKRQKIIPA